jgi:hypothetical protein
MYCERLCVQNIYVERIIATHYRAHCHTLPVCHTLPHMCARTTRPRALPRTAPHCRTAAHCYTLPHTAVHYCHTLLPHTVAHCRTAAHCHTLHTAIHSQEHCAHCRAHCAHTTHYRVHCHTLSLSPLALPHKKKIDCRINSNEEFIIIIESNKFK